MENTVNTEGQEKAVDEMEKDANSVSDEISEGVDSSSEVAENQDNARGEGEITEITDSDEEVPGRKDTNVLPNALPKFKDLISEPADPKKLITKNETQIEKAIKGYYNTGNLKALQDFMKLYMHFPRNLVRKAEGFIDILVQKKQVAEGHTGPELKLMTENQLMAVGNKIGLFFNGRKNKDEMIKAILEMQDISARRQKV